MDPHLRHWEVRMAAARVSSVEFIPKVEVRRFLRYGKAPAHLLSFLQLARLLVAEAALLIK